MVLASSILSTDKVLAALPVQRLKRSTLFVDVLSVKVFPKQLLLNRLPPQARCAKLACSSRRYSTNREASFRLLLLFACNHHICILMACTCTLQYCMPNVPNPPQVDTLCTHPRKTFSEHIETRLIVSKTRTTHPLENLQS